MYQPVFCLVEADILAGVHAQDCNYQRAFSDLQLRGHAGRCFGTSVVLCVYWFTDSVD